MREPKEPTGVGGQSTALNALQKSVAMPKFDAPVEVSKSLGSLQQQAGDPISEHKLARKIDEMLDE